MIVAISGTGTGVGKTTTAVAWIRALVQQGLRVRAWKPIETGGNADGEALTEACGADARATVQLSAPVAPSVAAREMGLTIDLHQVLRQATERAKNYDIFLLETAGGLFSPLSSTETNAELVALLEPDLHVLVAPNRLGVLHDVEACRRASRGLRGIDLVVLTGPPTDPSGQSNLNEIAVTLPVVALPAAGDARPLIDGLRGRWPRSLTAR